MTREIIVEAGPEETRVAVLEGGRAAEIHVERSDDRSLVGNVYLARVDRVLPGMQSAFVDAGLERHAFVHVSDVAQRVSDDDELRGNDARGIEPEPGADPDAAEDDGASLGKAAGPVASASSRPEPRIQDLLRAGQSVLVQVTREPLGRKGARVTTHVTLAGKHVVYMPLSDHRGVSKRIEDPAAREALRAVLDTAHVRHGGGVIARTDAVGRPAEEIVAEIGRLEAKWHAIQAAAATAQAPACLHREPGIAVKVVRDALASQISRIVVDDDAAHDELALYLRQDSPELVAVLQRHPAPAFESFGLEQEVDKALRNRVWLRSGGYLVIDQLEALVAIDVNTGKFTGARRLEDTVLQTNVEAAREVARQLRLRDLGGIVVVDFIDMQEEQNRRQVLHELESAFVRDRARTTVLGMSEFGLVEITRQRRKRSLESLLMEPCGYCGGSGHVRSMETMANHILRRVRALSPDVREVQVRVHPEVAARLAEKETAAREAGAGLAVRLRIVEEPGRHRESFELGS